MNALAGVLVELGDGLLHKYGGQVAAADARVQAAIADVLKPILERLGTLEADVQARLAELGMLLATTAAADGAAGVARAFEPKGTLPDILGGASITQMPPDWKPETDAQPIEDWDDVKTPTPGGDPK